MTDIINWQDYEREQMLADVAEMYYEEGKTQQDISDLLGITRSTVSRMLTEAQQKGVVEIKIHRPIKFDHDLEQELIDKMGLQQAKILVWTRDDYQRLQRYLGVAGARVLSDLLSPGKAVGLTWGTTLSAIVDAMQGHRRVDVSVVQLAGSLGARGQEYDAIALVQRLSQQLGGEPVYLNAPFIVESPEIANALKNNPSNKPAMESGRHCDIAVVGIGKVDQEFSTLYRGGHISLEELEHLQQLGAIGDACGHPFDSDGNPVAPEFEQRLVNISRDDLLAIPIRLGVAGGTAKAGPLLAALRGGYMTHLVTDSATASDILQGAQVDG